MLFRSLFSGLLAGLLLSACAPLAPSTGTAAVTSTAAPGAAPASPDYARPALRQDDVVYDPNIRSVQCFVRTGDISERLTPPIVPLTQDQPVGLEFDRLYTDPARLVVRLQLCNADWSPTDLVDQQFVYDYNEFYITEYYSSVNTRVPYYHYRFTMPRVKLTGNYVLHVFDADGTTPLLSRRILVFDNAIGVQMQQGTPPGGTIRNTLQQVDFSLTYAAIPLVNPAQSVQVVLRQNYRWDNARLGLRPTFVREFERRLDYQYFNYENAFPGLHEFRYFDTRSLRTGGFNVAQIDPNATPKRVLLVPEKSRQNQLYDQYNDINGYFLTDSREYGNGDTDADYADTYFQFQAPPDGEPPYSGRLYAVGQMTDWQLRPEFELKLDSTGRGYGGHALLKQGYYNYLFALKPPGQAPVDYTLLEGARYETENVYDLTVYYRAPGTRYDQIIGYKALTLNGRLPVQRR